MRPTALVAPLLLWSCAQPPPSAEPTIAGVSRPDSAQSVPSLTTPRPGNPPAISGGTLLMLHDGRVAVSDPDHDKIFVVDLKAKSVTGAIDLSPGDEPGRLVEDKDGRVHVALRRSGELLSFDPDHTGARTRRKICAEPRGVAYDTRRALLHVACAGGELLTFDSVGGQLKRTLPRDLRDVVVDGTGRLLVSRFKSAELIEVGPSGEQLSSTRPAPLTGPEPTAPTTFEPEVAWRVVVTPAGVPLMLHQRAGATPIAVATKGYGGQACNSGVVHSAITSLNPGGIARVSGILSGVVLGVDLAVSSTGLVAIANAGKNEIATLPMGTEGSLCLSGTGFARNPVEGQPVAVVSDPAGQFVYQTRNPHGVAVLGGPLIRLPVWPIENRGHELFHRDAGKQISCASCHPEGGEDGHVWEFGEGKRRTQSLVGGLLATAPFHWDGKMTDLTVLMKEVLTKRMGGAEPTSDDVRAMSAWLDSLRPVVPVLMAGAAVQRGSVIFHEPTVGCASCHSGPLLTTNGSVDVGTGGTFQIPSLRGVGARGPFLHDGCANTLADRFGACGGGDKHGATSQLDAGQVSDLVTFLETL